MLSRNKREGVYAGYAKANDGKRKHFRYGEFKFLHHYSKILATKSGYKFEDQYLPSNEVLFFGENIGIVELIKKRLKEK